MSYWKTKVVPKFKKLFDKGKKKAAAEACKSFDSSKESIDKELGDKESDLLPKVIAIYQSSTLATKKLLKEPNEPAVKENPEAAQSALQELTKAGFPGAQLLSDAAAKLGPALIPGPIVYLFQKTSILLVSEPLPEPEHATREIEIEPPAKTDETKESEAGGMETTVETTPPPPVIEEKGKPSQEKKEVAPEKAKVEEVVAVEAPKEAAAPVEAKKEVVAPVEVKTETVPAEAKKEVSPALEKKEEAPIEEGKKQIAPIIEEKKEEVAVVVVVATPSEVKREDVPKVEEKKEKPAETPASTPDKK